MSTSLLLMSLLACGTEPAAPAPADGHRHEGGHAHGDDDATMTHRFDDPEKWAKVFDDPERDVWQKPADVVAALELSEGMTVADIGAGTGYFNPHLAEAVGAEGTVIAVDIEQTLVDHMTERAQRDGTPQVEPRLGTPDDPGLKPAEVDRVLLVNVYHHISDRRDYFGRVAKAMKPEGRLTVVDYKPGDMPVGPPEDHRIAEDKVVSELQAAGWNKVARTELPYQFVLSFAVAE